MPNHGLVVWRGLAKITNQGTHGMIFADLGLCRAVFIRASALPPVYSSHVPNPDERHCMYYNSLVACTVRACGMTSVRWVPIMVCPESDNDM